MMAVLWSLAGFATGAVHFTTLRWNARQYLSGTGLLRAAGAQLLRLSSVAVLLGVAVRNGALPLLLVLAGVLLARLLVLRMGQAMP